MELRTDGHGVIRAQSGLLLTTYGRIHGRSHVTDLAETAGLLKGAQAQQAQFAQLAIDHQADERALDETVQARLKQQNSEIVGDGERAELTQAQAVLSSPAGVALSSTDSTVLAARDVALTSGQDVSVSTAARWLASVGHGVSLFTQSLGIKAFAARGKVQVQAQSDELEVFADQVAKFISAKKSIQIAAKDEVLLTAKGSYIRVNSAGIEQGTPATHIVYAATKAMVGPRSLAFGLPQLSNGKKQIINLTWSFGANLTPISKHSRHSNDLNLHIETVNYNAGESVSANIEYSDLDGNKQVISVTGQVDGNGVAIIKNVIQDKKLSFKYGNDTISH